VRRNKINPYPDNTWLWLAGANLLLCLAFLLFFILVTWLSIGSAQAWEFQSPISFDDDEPVIKKPTPAAPPEIRSTYTQRETAPPPPEVKPYKIPTLNGETRDFHYIPPIKLAKVIDADEVFRMIVNCFPERPKWGIEVKSVAGLRYTEQNSVSTFDTAGLSRYYAGIVAEMPLYSAEELNRQRTQEYQRRGEVATNVAAMLKALADRDRALRLIGIDESVEARSQIRVYEGLAPAEEQIGYLKEVASRTGDLVTAEAAITAARLTLVGQCRDELADQVNDYLKVVTQ
jgi:hypothetical protein